MESTNTENTGISKLKENYHITLSKKKGTKYLFKKNNQGKQQEKLINLNRRRNSIL